MPYTKENAYRDFNAHKAAVAARWFYHDQYARSGLGQMGFWDSLEPSQKRLCREMVEDIEQARKEPRK